MHSRVYCKYKFLKIKSPSLSLESPSLSLESPSLSLESPSVSLESLADVGLWFCINLQGLRLLNTIPLYTHTLKFIPKILSIKFL